jgi:hypothetical protein
MLFFFFFSYPRWEEREFRGSKRILHLLLVVNGGGGGSSG